MVGSSGVLLTDVVRDAGEAKAAERGLEVKTLNHESLFAGSTKVLDEEQGIASMIVAVTGIEDHVADIIEPGAIGPGLKSRWPKGIWHHTWEAPIAKTIDARELLPGDPELPKQLRDGTPWPAEAGAFKIDAQFNLETQRGRESFSDVKFYGDGQEYSIGYKVGKASRDKNGVRHIKSMTIPEWSPVLFGAMPNTSTLSTKDDCVGCDDKKSGFVNLPGSMEERLDSIEDALEKMLPVQGFDLTKSAARVVGTYEDRVVYAVSDDEKDDGEAFFEAAYFVDEKGDTVLGTPHPVDVSERKAEKSDDPLVAALEFAGEMRQQVKAGRVLSGANTAKIQAALDALSGVLEAAGLIDPEPDADDATKADPMAKKPHEYVAGDNGDCKTCGTSKGNPMHSAKADAAATDPPADKNHPYVPGPFGKCKTCGKPESDAAHTAPAESKTDPNDTANGGPDSTTHEYAAGQGGYCSKCQMVMTHPIHDAPYGRSYGGPVDGVGGNVNGSNTKGEVLTEIDLLKMERERAGL